jgi:hypothetical protein
LGIERNINRLSPAIRAEICKAEDRLNETIDQDPQPQLSGFHADGADHLAYFVPSEIAAGVVKFIFECLIY